MVHAALVLGAGCEYVLRPFEKIAWIIDLKYKGVFIELTHRKFGMAMGIAEDASEAIAEEFLQVLNRAFSVTDKVLRPLIDEQIRLGNCSIPNRRWILNARYRFFRANAEAAYRSQPPQKEVIRFDVAGRPTDWISDPFRPEREGFFYASAAIDAYFSCLEHLLVLMVPFIGFDPQKEDLLAFIRVTWSEKLKRIWDLTKDRDAKTLYDELRTIKERLRNSLSHGALEKEGMSLFVHVPALGALPASLSRFTESIHYGVIPFREASFADACELFDRTDRYLANGPTRIGLKYAESGLDVAFDQRSVAGYNAVKGSEEALDELIEYHSYLSDQATNMDW